MLELLFLLLPIAALYGWYMGQRSAKKSQETTTNQLSRDYVTGLNFLLSNQQEKAVDLFLTMLEKQENENNISSTSQFEAEITLGNLFRSRGEVDRALRIHKAVDSNENYSIEQKLLAKQQLAKDFMMAGFLDRAENYYILLLDEPDYAQHSLSQLMKIYQKTKEWEKAINVAEKLLRIAPETDKTPLAHYYCEYAQTLATTNEKSFISALEKALSYASNCARASILLGEFYLKKQDYRQALHYFEHILYQDVDYIGEVIDHIQQCYRILNEPENYELFLIKANQIKHNSSIDLALVEFIEQKDGIESAQTKLYQQISKHPNMLTFHRFIYYQMNDVEAGRGKESLNLLYKMVGEQIDKSFHYRCLTCGYQSYRLTWFCPSCRQWETIKPIQRIDNI